MGHHIVALCSDIATTESLADYIEALEQNSSLLSLQLKALEDYAKVKTYVHTVRKKNIMQALCGDG